MKGVQKTDGPDEKYKYKKVFSFIDRRFDSNVPLISYLLAKKEKPEGRYLGFKYYDYDERGIKSSDARADRIKCLLAPAGEDEKPIEIYKFVYEMEGVVDPRLKKKTKSIKGYTKNYRENITTVYDAYGHKTVYGYNPHHQLTSLIKYDENDTLYTLEKLYFGKKESSNWTQLISKTLSAYGTKICRAL